MRSRLLVRNALVLATLAVSGVVGCVSGSGQLTPDAPESPLLSRLWPNEDGNSWSYDYVSYVATETQEVPEAIARPADEISYAEVEALLLADAPLADTAAYFRAGTLEMRFDGRIAVRAGSKQRLRDTLIVDDGARAGSPVHERVPRALRKARDDAFALLANPTLLWGYSAFEKKGDWIGFYDEARRDSAFTLIKAPIESGEFFRHQFTRWGLFDETMAEYAWIAGGRSIEASNGVLIEDAVAVIYVIYWRVSYNEGPDPGGVSDTYSAVITYFAPDIGPVYHRWLGFFSTDPARPEVRRTLYAEARLREFSVEAEQ
ncbi:MAG: hypothetical protein ACKVU1_16170 [bacterium]